MTWAPDYVTRPELKSYLRIDDNADDAFIDVWITTVSGNVNDHCKRQFGRVASAEARTYTPVWDRHLCKWVTEVDDLQDITGLAIVDENATAITSYTFEPVNALKKGKPYERILTTSCTGDMTATALWGWTAVPSAVKTGMFLQGARLAARRDSPFGISGSPSEQGEIRLLAQLDPDFKTSLKPLRRDWWAG